MTTQQQPEYVRLFNFIPIFSFITMPGLFLKGSRLRAFPELVQDNPAQGAGGQTQACQPVPPIPLPKALKETPIPKGYCEKQEKGGGMCWLDQNQYTMVVTYQEGGQEFWVNLLFFLSAQTSPDFNWFLSWKCLY